LPRAAIVDDSVPEAPAGAQSQGINSTEQQGSRPKMARS